MVCRCDPQAGETTLICNGESDLFSVPRNREIIHGIPRQDSLRLSRGDLSDPQFGPSCLTVSDQVIEFLPIR